MGIVLNGKVDNSIAEWLMVQTSFQVLNPSLKSWRHVETNRCLNTSVPLNSAYVCIKPDVTGDNARCSTYTQITESRFVSNRKEHTKSKSSTVE